MTATTDRPDAAPSDNGRMQSLISIVAGIIVGLITLALTERAGNMVLASTMGIEPMTAQGAASLGIVRPAASLLVIVAAYGIGSFAGGWIAGRLAPARRPVHAVVVGACLMALGVVAVSLFPQPTWFRIATFATFLPAALAGAAVAGHFRA